MATSLSTQNIVFKLYLFHVSIRTIGFLYVSSLIVFVQ